MILKKKFNKVNILFGSTGSVAAIKVPKIIENLFEIYGDSNIDIILILTKSSEIFFKKIKINKKVTIIKENSWSNERILNFENLINVSDLKTKKTSFSVMIKNWCDIILIIPLSANTLSKISNGICDNLITSIIYHCCSSSRSSTKSLKKSIIVAPSMNTLMYLHPLTKKHLNILKTPEYGFEMSILEPVEKKLACGDHGIGGMCEWKDIVEFVKLQINKIQSEKSNNLIHLINHPIKI